MSIKLYYNDVSPPVRAVLLTAKALNVELELEEINIKDKEHLTHDFLELNPQHTIPTLVDGDFVLWDSHAIAAYLVGQYGKEDSLYPKDLRKRALIDQRLHFDSGVLYPRIQNILYPLLILNEKEISKEKISAITEAYTFLNMFLQHSKYLTGDTLTIADLCCVATVSSATLIIPISTERYPNLSAWYHLCKSLPFYEEANGVGLNKLDGLVEEKLGTPRQRGIE